MTSVEFSFITSTGDPLVNTDFEVQLTRTDFNEEQTGVVMPRVVTGKTDETGKAVLDLIPTDAKYHVTAYDPLSEAYLHYDFLVPVMDTPGMRVRLQDIVVRGKMPEKGFDEMALASINNIKANLLSVSVDVHETADTVADALLELPVTSVLPPANPRHGMEWTHEPSGRRYTWMDAWVETAASMVVVSADSASGQTGFDPSTAVLVVDVANPATSTIIIEEGGIPKRIEVDDLIASLGTSVEDLSAAVDFAPTDYLILSQSDGVERRCTLAQLASYLKTI